MLKEMKSTNAGVILFLFSSAKYASVPAPIFADENLWQRTGTTSAMTLSGVAFIMQFEGDIFEMEDQRNWTDAILQNNNCINFNTRFLQLPGKIL